jgi:hypothetical protein
LGDGDSGFAEGFDVEFGFPQDFLEAEVLREDFFSSGDDSDGFLSNAFFEESEVFPIFGALEFAEFSVFEFFEDDVGDNEGAGHHGEDEGASDGFRVDGGVANLEVELGVIVRGFVPAAGDDVSENVCV